jgi:hypothetical protein
MADDLLGRAARFCGQMGGVTEEHVAYVETPNGIYRETDGRMEGPFTREELGLSGDQFLPGAQTVSAAGANASLSFGFGYGAKADNRFERGVTGGASDGKTNLSESVTPAFLRSLFSRIIHCLEQSSVLAPSGQALPPAATKLMMDAVAELGHGVPHRSSSTYQNLLSTAVTYLETADMKVLPTAVDLAAEARETISMLGQGVGEFLSEDDDIQTRLRARAEPWDAPTMQKVGDWLRSRGTPEDEIARNYGVEGVNFGGSVGPKESILREEGNRYAITLSTNDGNEPATRHIIGASGGGGDFATPEEASAALAKLLAGYSPEQMARVYGSAQPDFQVSPVSPASGGVYMYQQENRMRESDDEAAGRRKNMQPQEKPLTFMEAVMEIARGKPVPRVVESYLSRFPVPEPQDMPRPVYEIPRSLPAVRGTRRIEAPRQVLKKAVREEVGLYLKFLPANQAWCFCFGESTDVANLTPTSMGDQTIFPNREEAVQAAAGQGLSVSPQGKVESVAKAALGEAENNNCDGAGPHTVGEVRMLPYGGDGNLILCKACYARELAYRGESSPSWDSAPVYSTEARRRKTETTTSASTDAGAMPAGLGPEEEQDDVLDGEDGASTPPAPGDFMKPKPTKSEGRVREGDDDTTYYKDEDSLYSASNHASAQAWADKYAEEHGVPVQIYWHSSSGPWGVRLYDPEAHDTGDHNTRADTIYPMRKESVVRKVSEPAALKKKIEAAIAKAEGRTVEADDDKEKPAFLKKKTKDKDDEEDEDEKKKDEGWVREGEDDDDDKPAFLKKKKKDDGDKDEDDEEDDDKKKKEGRRMSVTLPGGRVVTGRFVEEEGEDDDPEDDDGEDKKDDMEESTFQVSAIGGDNVQTDFTIIGLSHADAVDRFHATFPGYEVVGVTLLYEKKTEAISADEQLQVGEEVVYSGGEDGIPSGAKGQVIFRVPGPGSFTYNVDFPTIGSQIVPHSDLRRVPSAAFPD